MNMRDCKKLKTGSLVREAWNPYTTKHGIVLAKEYVEGSHRAKMLGGWKERRYDIWVHWHRPRDKRPNPEKLQCWELMLVKNFE